MYQVRFLEEASASLAILDKAIARRIIRKINWLAENAHNIKQKGLHSDLSGLSKLREGDYRIIYQILEDEKIIMIHLIGHRSEIYKKRN